MSVGQRAQLGSLSGTHKHLASSRGGLQFLFGKGQRTASQTQVWAETWLLASNSSNHAQQGPASSEVQSPPASALLPWFTGTHPPRQAPLKAGPGTPRTGLLCRLIARHLGRPAHNPACPQHHHSPPLSLDCGGGGMQGYYLRVLMLEQISGVLRTPEWTSDTRIWPPAGFFTVSLA